MEKKPRGSPFGSLGRDREKWTRAEMPGCRTMVLSCLSLGNGKPSQGLEPLWTIVLQCRERLGLFCSGLNSRAVRRRRVATGRSRRFGLLRLEELVSKRGLVVRY